MIQQIIVYKIFHFIYIINSKMDEKPDHPHFAAVHLMKALRCCKECYQPNQAQILQIQQLQIRRQLLTQQLRSLRNSPSEYDNLKIQISELQLLISQLQHQNIETQRLGQQQIRRLQTDRNNLNLSQKQSFIIELNNEKAISLELTRQLQNLFQRVKYLNRINNDLIYHFTKV